jgi:hypothetical protein
MQISSRSFILSSEHLSACLKTCLHLVVTIKNLKGIMDNNYTLTVLFIKYTVH